MKKQKVLYLLSLIILFFLFSSCKFIMSIFAPEKEEEEIGEFDDINIFDADLLPDDNSFTTDFSITGDEYYLYGVTRGYRDFPGKIVKISKNGGLPLIKTLYDEAIHSGYTDSHAFYMESISYHNDHLIIKALPDFIQFEHHEFELFCLSSEDLSVRWRWIPEENSRLDYYVTGHPTIPKWNDYYIVYYAVEKEAGYYIVFLDTNGNQIVKRKIQSSRPVEENDLCIINDKLVLHQSYEPLIIYDLNKLSNRAYAVKDSIDYAFTSEDKTLEANPFSNIVSDGKNCYFCSWTNVDRVKGEGDLKVFALSLSDYKILWTYELKDKGFDEVNSILVNKEKLFLAADYGCVYCLNTINGKLNWKTKITDKEHKLNLLCEGCIVKNYFVIPCASNGYLYYFDINTGKIKGKYEIPVFGGIRHCYVEDDYVYITTGSYIVRLRLKEK